MALSAWMSSSHRSLAAGLAFGSVAATAIFALDPRVAEADSCSTTTEPDLTITAIDFRDLGVIGGSRQVEFDVTVKNIGGGDYISGEGQQAVAIELFASDGARTHVAALPFRNVARGASIVLPYRRVWTAAESAAPPRLRAILSFDLDIGLDGVCTNNDRNGANDSADRTTNEAACAVSGAFCACAGPVLSSVSFTSGGTAPQLNQSSIGTVHGTGFCPGMSMIPGNALAEVPLSVALDGRSATAKLPALTTPGSVKVRTSPVATPRDMGNFALQYFRKTNGFTFPNDGWHGDPTTIGRWFDVYGFDAFALKINLCWPFGECLITLPVPDPISLIYAGAWDLALNDGNGTCFGYSLGSQRLMLGQKPFTSFSGTATNVWQLDASGALASWLDEQHILQASSQFIDKFLQQKLSTATGLRTAATLRSDIQSDLTSGRGRILTLAHGGSGHVVVAYALEDAPTSGEYYVRVYDPNIPVERDASGSVAEHAFDGTLHRTRDQSLSRILVRANGSWFYQGNFATSPWEGQLTDIISVSPLDIPLHPSLLSGLAWDRLGIVFGAGTPSSVRTAAATAPGSSLSSDVAVIRSFEQVSKPAAYVVDKTANVHVTAMSDATLKQDIVIAAGASVARVQASGGKSAQVDVAKSGAQVTYTTPKDAQKTSQTITMQKRSGDHAITTGSFTAELSTVGASSSALEIKDSGATYQFTGPRTQVTFTASALGAAATPVTFRAPLVVSDGDRVDFDVSWQSLDATTLQAHQTDRAGKVTVINLKNAIILPLNITGVNASARWRPNADGFEVDISTTLVGAGHLGVVAAARCGTDVLVQSVSQQDIANTGATSVPLHVSLNLPAKLIPRDLAQYRTLYAKCPAGPIVTVRSAGWGEQATPALASKEANVALAQPPLR